MNRLTLSILLSAALLAPAMATPPSPALADAIGIRAGVERALEQYNEHTTIPVPALTREQMDELLGGEVVKVRRQLDPVATGDRKSIVSYFLADAPRADVWIAALDPHYLASDRLTEVRLDGDGQGGSRWYQHFELPWPVEDRHWMIDITKGTELCAATDGGIWEHQWQLTPDGEALAREAVAAGKAGKLEPKNIKNAVYLPANTGAWVMCKLTEERTLLVYHVTTVFGGAVPDSWIATFAYPQLDKLLRGVVKRSPEMAAHFGADHSPIFGGDGQPVRPTGR